MQPDDQKICLLLAQEVNDCFNRPPLEQMAVQFDAVAFRLDARLILKFSIKLQPVILQDLRNFVDRLPRQRRYMRAGQTMR